MVQREHEGTENVDRHGRERRNEKSEGREIEDTGSEREQQRSLEGEETRGEDTDPVHAPMRSARKRPMEKLTADKHGGRRAARRAGGNRRLLIILLSADPRGN